MKRSWFLSLFIPLLLMTFLLATSCSEGKTEEMETVYRESPPIMGAARKSAYLRPEGSASFPVTAPLVVLRGTWMGMGEEYGRRAAVEIRHVFEGLNASLEQVGIDQQTLVEATEDYRTYLGESAPHMLEFMEGIADGSSLEIAKSSGGADLDAIQKIILINFFSALYESAPGSERTLQEEGSCWECRASLNAEEKSLAGANVDGSFYPFMYRLALIVIPDDPETFRYFTLPVAGSVGGPVGFNEEGLFTATLPVLTPSSADGASEPGQEQGGRSPVLSSSFLSTLALSNSRDVRSAEETILFGPHDIGTEAPESLIPCVSSNFLISDVKDSLVLERDNQHYGVRTEEPAPNDATFIATTDHFEASESYDATGEAASQPMSAFGLSEQDVAGSTVRMRSLRGLFRSGAVNVDAAWMMVNAAGMNYTYDEQGRKSYQIDNALGQVVSCFESGLTVDRYVPLGNAPYFGTVCSIIVDPSSLDIWYELGLPSDWVGPWEHVNLGDYNR